MRRFCYSRTPHPHCATYRETRRLQLRALVAHADPFATFHAIAARAGLPLPRVYRLARHLCEWKRARVIAVVRPDAVYAVDEVPLSIPVDARDAVRASDAMILAAFGPCKRLGDALDVLETTRGRDAATERVLALLRRGTARAPHVRPLRLDAAPPPGLGAVATAARGKPARGERSDHLRVYRPRRTPVALSTAPPPRSK